MPNSLGDYYSQSTEEMHIVPFFSGRRGKFLDVGAYNGKDFSNTYRLALLGWSGVCIEPSPMIYPQLKKLYENNPKIKTINIALGDRDGDLDFFDSPHAVGTARSEHYEKWKNYKPDVFKKTVVPMLSFRTFYVSAPSEYQFVSIDTEGMDYQIVKDMAPYLAEMKTELICIEYTYDSREIYDVLRDVGFNLIHQNTENILLRRA